MAQWARRGNVMVDSVCSHTLGGRTVPKALNFDEAEARCKNLTDHRTRPA